MKIGKLIIPENEKRLHVNYTDYVVYSYDKENFKFRFAFENYPEINGEAYLILKADDMPTQQFTLTIENKRAEWIVPERLLGYEGHVKGYLYLTENDLIKSEDAYMYTFLMRRSQIDEGVLEIESMYFEKFEDLVAKMNLRFDELSASASNVFNDYKSFADKKKEDIANVDLDISSDVDEIYNSLLEFYLKSKNLMTEEVKRVADKKVLVYIEMENLLKSTEKSVETMLYDIQNKLTDIDLAKDSAMIEIERYINQIKEMIKQAEDVLGGIISDKIYTKNEVDTILLDKASVKRVEDLEDTQERNFTDIKLELSTGLRNKADKNAFDILDAEVMDARKPFGEEAFPNLGKRLDEQIGLSSDFREFEAGESFMKRIFNEQSERGVNVKWFGAIGDGVTDDTVAIQSAIDYAYARRPMTVKLPMAKYAIQPIVVKNGVRLVSSTANIPYAWNALVESGFIAKSATDNFLVTVEKGATLENIIVDSNLISRGVDCARDGKLENVTCFRSKSTGIILNGGMANNIRSAHNLGQGVIIAKSDTLLSNFFIFGNRGDGLELQKWVDNNSFVNGKIEFNDKANISLYLNSNNYFANINIDRAGRYGISAKGARATFVNCQLWRSYKLESGGAHIFMEGETTINFIGGNITKGVDDDGGGLESPTHIAKTYDSTKMTLNIVGVYATNACTGEPFYGAIKSGLSSTLLTDLIESKSDTHTFTPIASSDLLQKKEGQVFYNKNTKKLEMYNGGHLVGTNGLIAGQNYYDKKNVTVSKSSSQSVTLSLGFEVSKYSRLGATLELHMRRAESGSGGVSKIPIMLAREAGTTTVTVGTPQNLIGSLFNATDLVISSVTVDINNVLTVEILNNNARLSANGQIILSQ